MPHCWPQKQQCVFTRRSGGWRVFSSHPPGGASLRCGPQRAVRASMEAGSSAKALLLLHADLGGAEALPFARRAERLPMPGRTLDAVVEPELRQHVPDVIDVKRRCEGRAAAGA